jgi:hypothetical protein
MLRRGAFGTPIAALAARVEAVAGTALAAPTLIVESEKGTYPGAIGFDRPSDWQDNPNGPWAVMQASADGDPLFGPGKTEVVNRIYAAVINYDFGVAAATPGPDNNVNFRMAAWNGTRLPDDELNWSDIANIGDTVAPTLSSSTGASWVSGAPILVTVTSDELCYFSLAGTDAASMELVGSQPATSIQVRLAGNANTIYDTKHS